MKERDRRAAGYWTAEDGAHMTKFFNQLARDHELDPTQPESWYPFTEDAVIAAQVCSFFYTI